MNRKIFEDVKVNHIKKTQIIPNKDIIINDIGNHNPTNFIKDKSSKYEFLKKKNNNLESQNIKISRSPHLPIKNKKLSISKVLIFFLIISMVVGLVYLFSTILLKVNIVITPKSKIFELKHQKLVAGNAKSQIPFEVMIVSDSEYRDIVLTNSKEVSEKAKGEIILYNEYSVNKQKILSGSYISDEKGKAYKIDSSIYIPGYTLDKSKKIIPGQVSVGITAFLPGDTYNGNPELLNFNSYKNTDKYKKIYGKIKTKLDGGTIGLVYMLGDNEKEEILNKSFSFKEKLIRKLSAQVPLGYILYPDATNYSCIINDNTYSKTPNYKIEIKCNLTAMLLKENELSDSIINLMLPNIDEKEKREILPPTLSVLSLNFPDKTEVIYKDIQNLNFELSGNLSINWSPNIEEIKEILKSKNKDDVSVIFKSDPGILSAKMNIIPFWSKVLPSDVKNINIIIK